MAASPNLLPLEVEHEGNLLRFSFSPHSDILPELPADYEQQLAGQLGEYLVGQKTPTAEVDLRNLAGISSRQLGSLIALQKILRPRVGRIRLTGVSPAVRNLLKLTQVDQLFEME